MFGWVPGLQAFTSYRRKWLARNVIAGVVLRCSARRGFLVLGPDSSLGPMIAATILPLAGATGSRAGDRAGSRRGRRGDRRDHGPVRNLPQPALAAVVITASLSLADTSPGTVRLS